MTEIEEEVFDEYYTLPIGKARTVKEGNDLTIIAYGASVHWAKETVAKNNIDAEIINIHTLMPWDKEAVFTSVKKTGKAIIYHEDTLTGGIGAEIAACIAADCFRIFRCTRYENCIIRYTSSIGNKFRMAIFTKR